MKTAMKDHISLAPLKNKVGAFHHQFKGSGQQDAHEFLMLFLAWLCKELMRLGGWERGAVMMFRLLTVIESHSFPCMGGTRQGR